MCVIAAYDVQCLVAGCRGQVQDSRLCVQEDGCCNGACVVFCAVHSTQHNTHDALGICHTGFADAKPVWYIPIAVYTVLDS